MKSLWTALGCVVALAACGSGEPAGSRPAGAEAGLVLYRDHGCPLCHGAAGAGDGPLAPTLVSPPRDLRDPGSYDRGAGAEDVAATLETGLPRNGALVMQPYPHIPAADRLSIGLWIASLQAAGVGAEETAEARTAREEQALVASSGWARATPPGSDTSAAYVTLENRGADPVSLVGATSPRAAAVEIHLMTMEDGRMSMTPQPELGLDPGEIVRFEPGGTHLMLIGLDGALAEGESLAVTLSFSAGPELELDLPVRREAPGGGR